MTFFTGLLLGLCFGFVGGWFTGMAKAMNDEIKEAEKDNDYFAGR